MSQPTTKPGIKPEAPKPESSAVAQMTVEARKAGKKVDLLAEKTGIPALVIAATLLVIGYKILRDVVRLAWQVAIVVIIFLLLSYFKVIRW